jgi:sulfoxide reductase heme-binding subunit YedZ
LSTNPLDYGWWLASRSMGIVAFIALSAAVVMGLAMALKLVAPRRRPALNRGHERMALLALGAIAAHGLLLLPDSWLQPGAAGVFVPFANPYRPFWTGLGVCAAYLTAGLALTWYARRWIGARRWRNAHRFIPIAWLLAAVHVLGAGTDADSTWLLAPLVATVALVAFMLLLRWRKSLSGGGGAGSASASRGRTSSPAPAAPRPPSGSPGARGAAPAPERERARAGAAP